MERKNWAGIDYGSKLAGTSAIVFADSNNQLIVLQSEKKKDADKWLIKNVEENCLKELFIDAPLTLPEVYRLGGNGDFFYRSADRELKCMSPMFLGGLTARAMRLRQTLMTSGIDCFETYPAALAKACKLENYGYKKNGLQDCIQEIQALMPEGYTHDKDQITNWHRFDALLAWISGHALRRGAGEWVGEQQEGRIGVYRPETI